MSSLLALVPAAGRGERFGGAVAKQFLAIAGRPVVAWTVERLLAFGAEQVVVALPAGANLARLGIRADRRVEAVEGGATRQASVASCLLAAAAAPDDLVAVHDGARPALARADFDAVVGRAREAGAAILGRALDDTLKRIADDRVVATVDRRDLFRAETPQVFRAAILRRAIERAAADRFLGTDEASLVERLAGVEVAPVFALHPNPKLTLPADREWIERLLVMEERGA
ncbi:MAG: 2-C-methyl-D-erythritol 4-phosphate cytidylyltransferase [Thermoanaerobaculia bacterium]